jgi:hypothetical protein
MDNYLKLKLEVVYRGLPIEQARQRFEEMKQQAIPVLPPEKQKRKIKK